VECLLTKYCPKDSNYLTIQVTPNAGFSLTLNAKKPGFSTEVVPVKMEFCHSCLWQEQTAEAYEVLFEEVIRGERSVSVRFDEIEYAWKVVDELEEMNLPVHIYKSGSIGPVECDLFAKKHGMRWRS
jgi:glucose-6-phosphate 1-dehydrogenase